MKLKSSRRPDRSSRQPVASDQRIGSCLERENMILSCRRQLKRISHRYAGPEPVKRVAQVTSHGWTG
nr:hypothetical protein CFP56_31602 [Quercus suber]